ncbi:MAG: transglutaminase family protein, partial [Halobacteriaceae archaeon]
VVGYTPGQRVGPTTWVVRGVDAHAWVEVYFPNYGWVQFDPTPAASREMTETTIVEEAREANVTGVDARGSSEGSYTPPTTTTNSSNSSPGGLDSNLGSLNQRFQRPENATGTINVSNVSNQVNVNQGGDEDEGIGISITPQTAAIWMMLVVGLVAGARRTGISSRLSHGIWLCL